MTIALIVSLGVCACMYAHVCICEHVHMSSACTYMCICICVHVCSFVCLWVLIHTYYVTCEHVCSCVHMQVAMVGTICEPPCCGMAAD